MIRSVLPPLRVGLALALLLPSLAVAQPASPPAAPTPAPASASLPDDLPIYTPSAVVSSMASPERGTIVTLRSDDDPAAIFEWYRAEFEKRGWRVDRQSETGGQHLVTALKGARKASLLITRKVSAASPDRDEAQILLVVTEER